jgi:hypothetical protein
MSRNRITMNAHIGLVDLQTPILHGVCAVCFALGPHRFAWRTKQGKRGSNLKEYHDTPLCEEHAIERKGL